MKARVCMNCYFLSGQGFYCKVCDRTKAKTIALQVVAVIVMGLLIALSTYIGISRSICSNLHYYTAQEQSAMHLTADDCAHHRYF